MMPGIYFNTIDESTFPNTTRKAKDGKGRK